VIICNELLLEYWLHVDWSTAGRSVWIH